jgi:toxin ParE1/3/4
LAQVVWTPQALEDLDAVCEYIARDSRRIANVFALRAFAATDRLELFPQSGRIVPELEQEDVREIILFSYRLIYRLWEGEVQILTVHHGARLFPGLSEQAGDR